MKVPQRVLRARRRAPGVPPERGQQVGQRVAEAGGRGGVRADLGYLSVILLPAWLVVFLLWDDTVVVPLVGVCMEGEGVRDFTY